MNFSSGTIKKIRQQKVGIVYQFGSRIQGMAGDKSDFDVGIVFTDPLQIKNLSDIHPILYDIFCQEFPVTFENDVDIAYLQEASLHFQFQVISGGKALYEVSPFFRANYEEKVIKEYLDFLPIEKQFSKAILERTE